ncbi:hypothetical protein EIP86_008934 [Pleurotus ostreatoroseus]|nr:hypothetical protein EIP86_008934 [Pleurotus ostreatoroseus]
MPPRHPRISSITPARLASLDAEQHPVRYIIVDALIQVMLLAERPWAHYYPFLTTWCQIMSQSCLDSTVNISEPAQMYLTRIIGCITMVGVGLQKASTECRVELGNFKIEIRRLCEIQLTRLDMFAYKDYADRFAELLSLFVYLTAPESPSLCAIRGTVSRLGLEICHRISDITHLRCIPVAMNLAFCPATQAQISLYFQNCPPSTILRLSSVLFKELEDEFTHSISLLLQLYLRGRQHSITLKLKQRVLYCLTAYAAKLYCRICGDPEDQTGSEVISSTVITIWYALILLRRISLIS